MKLSDKYILVEDNNLPMGKCGNGFCKNCGGFFMKKVGYQIYCSRKCEKEFNGRYGFCGNL